MLNNYIPKEDPYLSEKYLQAKQQGMEPVILDKAKVLEIEAEIEKFQNKLYKLQQSSQKIKLEADVSKAKRTIESFRGTIENKDYQIDVQWNGNTFATLNFKPLVEQIRQARKYISDFIQKLKTKAPERLKQNFTNIKNKAKEINSAFNKMPNITNKINNSIKRYGNKFKIRTKTYFKICNGSFFFTRNLFSIK